ncbi:Transferase [Melia azedarach]|uniref:Transferase n=1 Tax=Melia azedarach TaxID=155640 RepID=A0ACC1XRX9_MELAZ|nr:Transferase [Melia azedarach]
MAISSSSSVSVSALASQTPSLVSKCTVFPDQKSSLGDLKLSVSDLPMLSCHYIQKGGLFLRPPLPIDALISLLKGALSQTLSKFPPVAGRLKTNSDGAGYIYITCNDAGVEFIHKNATFWSIGDVLSPVHVPDLVKSFFAFDGTISYEGHNKPILAVQVTELSDGLFIGCTMNHAVTDGTSFWHFFNTFAAVTTGVENISKLPNLSRDSVLISNAVLKIPDGGLKVTFDENEPLNERIFSFSKESIIKLKARVNMQKSLCAVSSIEISSFQSLCALLWRAVTRARKLPATKMTTFRMAVNCRHRLNPKLHPYYFGNAIQSIPTYASASDVVWKNLCWCAEQLNKNVNAHDDDMVRRLVESWESNPMVFPARELRRCINNDG